MSLSGHKHPTVAFHAPTELVDKLKERSQANGWTRTELILEALWYYLLNVPIQN